MNFLMIMLMVFLGVCVFLINRHNELSRFARFSLILNPLMLMLALSAFTYQFVIKEHSSFYVSQIGSVKEAAEQPEPVRKQAAEILKNRDKTVSARIADLQVLLESSRNPNASPVSDADARQ